MSNKKISIGLFGFGCVGQGLYDVLSQTNGIQADIVKICVKDKSKKRKISPAHFTFDKNEILDNPQINVVVELIDDADAAFEIVSAAMRKGKGVVTANKKMVAEHFEELLALQQEYKVPLLYEGACCASIPIIRNLEEYYDNDLLHAIEGIFNGSSNYILSKIFREGKSYEAALKEAQELGFAETNPLLDVGGFDPKYKLCIIAAHAFGTFIAPGKVFNYGIQHISDFDFRFAREKGYKIKLVPKAKKLNGNLCLYVLPQFIPSSHPLSFVEDEYNGVIVEGAFSDKQYFVGKGAGSHPTGSAVLSDISALTYHYRYEYKKRNQGNVLNLTNDVILEIYLRFKHDSLLDRIQFQTIEEIHREKDCQYVIGKISLQKLVDSGVAEDPDVFIAQTANDKIILAKEWGGGEQVNLAYKDLLESERFVEI